MNDLEKELIKLEHDKSLALYNLLSQMINVPITEDSYVVGAYKEESNKALRKYVCLSDEYYALKNKMWEEYGK